MTNDTNLTERLKDPNTSNEAFYGLLAHVQVSDGPVLIEILANPEYGKHKRGAIAYKLGSLECEGAFEALEMAARDTTDDSTRQLCDSGHYRVRTQAILALAMLGDERAVPLLCEIAAQVALPEEKIDEMMTEAMDKSESKGFWAYSEAARATEPELEKAGVSTDSDARERLRKEALSALGRIGSIDAMGTVLQVIGEEGRRFESGEITINDIIQYHDSLGCTAVSVCCDIVEKNNGDSRLSEMVPVLVGEMEAQRFWLPLAHTFSFIGNPAVHDLTMLLGPRDTRDEAFVCLRSIIDNLETKEALDDFEQAFMEGIYDMPNSGSYSLTAMADVRKLVEAQREKVNGTSKDDMSMDIAKTLGKRRVRLRENKRAKGASTGAIQKAR